MKNKRTKTTKLLALFLLVLTLSSCLVPFSLHAEAPASKNQASHILLYCLSTETMLYEQNTDVPIDPGYTSQLMTALLAIEYDPEMTKSVTLSEELLDSWSFTKDFRSYLDYGFSKNATVPIKDLLAVMVLENATSASTLLGAAIGGSTEDFVTMMNERAKELGMESTVFTSPAGFANENATTTLSDLFKLTTLLYDDPRYMDLASARSYTLKNNNFTVYTRNYLIGNWYTTDYRYSKATGMKTDSAIEKSNPHRTSTVIATAKESDEFDYLVMIMGAEGSAAYKMATDFFKWGSTDFGSLKVLSRATLFKLLPVEGGDHTDEVPIFPEKDLTAFLPKSITLEDVTYDYTLTRKKLTAPLSYGTKVGEVRAIVDGKVVGSCNLIVGQNLAKGKSAQVYGVVGSIIFSPIVLFLLTAALIVLALFLLHKYLVYRRQKSKTKRKPNNPS